MTDDSGPPEQQVTAVATLRAAFDQARSAITTCADAHVAFLVASAVANELRQMADATAELRAAAAARIYTVEALSLAQLANRIGVSKARADQLMQSARRTRRARERKP